MSQLKFLSYTLSSNTPTYGNRLKVNIGQYKTIADGSTVNESFIELPLHAGTHIDFPKHFYDDGQVLKDFGAEFWVFQSPAIVEISPKNLILEKDLIEELNQLEGDNYDIIFIKTGACNYRNEDRYWSENHGLHDSVSTYIKEKFPKVRVVGFDFISLTSIQHREVGKAAHLAFLDPINPLLVIEDMDLTTVDKDSNFEEVVVSPLLVDGVDGVPVTCIAKIY